MLYNHHHNVQINSMTYDQAHTHRDMQHTHAITPRNHYGYTNGRALQSKQLIDHKFLYDNHYHKVYYPSLAFNHQVTAPISQWEPVVSEASLLALVMIEQPII